jgi:Spondin-like TSP1 domain/Thrombospondin type 1 domain
MKGKTIGIAIIVLCVCASIIVGALAIAGVFKKKSPPSSPSGTPAGAPSPRAPSGAPSPRTPSRTPGTQPGAYSGPSYAPAPGPAPTPSDDNTPSPQQTFVLGQWDSTGCTFPDSRAKKSDFGGKQGYCKNWCKGREADPCCSGLGETSDAPLNVPSFLQGLCRDTCGNGGTLGSNGICNCPGGTILDETTMACKLCETYGPPATDGSKPCCFGYNVDPSTGNCRGGGPEDWARASPIAGCDKIASIGYGTDKARYCRTYPYDPCCPQTPNTNTPVDCAVSAWGDWSGCSVSCGDGVQSRHRTVTTYPANGGQACPPTTENRTCHPQDCVIYAGIPIPGCNSSDSKNYNSKTEYCRDHPTDGCCPTTTCPPGNYLHDGSCTPCGYNAYKSTSGTDLAECLSCPEGTSSWNAVATDASACKQNCVGSWGPCQGTCGTGQMTYTVTSPGQPGGRACEAQNGQVTYCQLPNECSSRQELLSQATAQGSKDTCPLASDGPCNHDDDCPNFNNGSMCQDNGFGLKCCT